MAARSLGGLLLIAMVMVMMAIAMPHHHHGPLATNALTVHVVCHTHDDVGWLKTVDQYFVGLNNSIQHAMVQYILDSVIHQLDLNSNRTFVYVEQAFFQRWWRQATPAQQAITKRVVANGQLEFINGGWCMHDEATTHYVDMVDQTTLGHSFLLEEFGVTPTIGWQIDPFGHSATQAALLSAEVGFDALFFGRMDYQDHDIRMAAKNMEFLWRASESLGPTAQVFTGAFQAGLYGPPDGLCFDQTCDNEMQQVQADPALEDYNLDYFVETFVQQALSQAQNTRGNLDTMNIMFNMGSDFEHENGEWFKSLDKLIDAVNKDGRVKALYSTPSRYVAAKNAEPVSWTVKTDDFFPYADGPQSYWTGYFTSRPALKRYVRMQSAFLQVARQLELFTGGDGTATEPLWEAQSVAQHHDAVSGTEMQHVAYDYALRLAKGGAVADAMVQKAIGSLVTPSGTTAPPSFSSCPLANISLCDVTQAGSNVVVVLYNALARERTEAVLVPINSSTVTVYDSANNVVPSIAIPVTKTPANDVPGAAPYTLAFEATVPGLGASTYFIVFSSSSSSSSSEQMKHTQHTKDTARSFSDVTLSISNDVLSLTFDANGALASATNLTSGNTYPLTFEFAYYQAYQGNGQDDGAYIFLPDGTPSVNYTEPTLVAVTQTNVVAEVTVSYAEWLFLTVRLRNGSSDIEFQYSVGSVPIDDGIGKNVIVRYTSQLQSEATWYTDSNGRELQQRVRNARPTWNWNPTEPVTGNYYPVNTLVGLTDFNTSTLSVVVDRSQGCASLQDGQIEIMVHRRLLVDDGRGVGEPLNETMGGITQDGTRIGPGLRITGSHFVRVGALEGASRDARLTQNRVYQPLHASFAPLTTSVSEYVASHTTSFSFLQTPLPENVELMTLQARGDGSVLVRLAHQFGVHEDEQGGLSGVATVDLSTLFVQKVQSVKEVSLTANQPAGAHKPYAWNTTTSASVVSERAEGFTGGVNGAPLDGTVVTLSPLQIRTFVVVI